MPHCYDLVDTLVNVSYPVENITSVIYEPKGAFVIITAQSPGTHTHLYAQVKKLLPNVKRIHTVRTGTDKAEGKRKATILKRLGAHSYTDNNTHILATIREQLPDLELFIMRDGKRTRYTRG
jgi:hypothetical protein